MKLTLPQITICTAFLLTGAALAWAQGDAKDLYLNKCATCHGPDGMGKTAKGAVWLNADEFSPYDFWQYWRNTEDADVGRFLRLFTELPMDEILRLEALGGRGREGRILGEEAHAIRVDADVAVSEKAFG